MKKSTIIVAPFLAGCAAVSLKYILEAIVGHAELGWAQMNPRPAEIRRAVDA
jgi:hypothetical protein